MHDRSRNQDVAAQKSRMLDTKVSREAQTQVQNKRCEHQASDMAFEAKAAQAERKQQEAGAHRSQERNETPEQGKWERERQRDEKSLCEPWSEMRAADQTELKEQFRKVAQQADAANATVKAAVAHLAERQSQERSDLLATQARRAENAKSEGPSREREVRKAQDAEHQKLQDTQEVERKQLAAIERAIESQYQGAQQCVADARDQSQRRGGLEPEAVKKLQEHAEAIAAEARRARQLDRDAGAHHEAGPAVRVQAEKTQAQAAEQEEGASHSQERSSQERNETPEQGKWERERQRDEKSLREPWSEMRAAAETELKAQFQKVAEQADEAQAVVTGAAAHLEECQSRERRELHAAHATQWEKAHLEGSAQEREVRARQDRERQTLQDRHEAERQQLAEAERAIKAQYESAEQCVAEARTDAERHEGELDPGAVKKLWEHAELIEEEAQRVHKLAPEANPWQDARQVRSAQKEQTEAPRKEQQQQEQQQQGERERPIEDKSVGQRQSEQRAAAEFKEALRKLTEQADEAHAVVKEAADHLEGRQGEECRAMDAAHARQADNAHSAGPEREREVRAAQDRERQTLEDTQAAERQQLAEIARTIEIQRRSAEQFLAEAQDKSQARQGELVQEAAKKLQEHAELIAEESRRARKMASDAEAAHQAGRVRIEQKEREAAEPRGAEESARKTDKRERAQAARSEPGKWMNDMTAGRNMSAAAGEYQSKISGRKADEGYYVGNTQFDGYRNRALLDAKYFTDEGRFAKAYQDLAQGQYKDYEYAIRKAYALLDEAKRQIKAAKETSIEWHVAGHIATEAIKKLFDRHGINIKVIHDPP